MKFYNRELELAELKRIQLLAFESSKMTVVTGRRRIGKTSLIVKATEGTASVYLFVGRKNEAVLVDEFVPIIRQSLNVFVPDGMRTFRSLFQYLMEIGMHQSFNLIIDEFQEFYTVNKSVFGDIQNLWDQYRKKTKVNLIVSGSVYSLMHKIFQEEKEPLFGRADNIMKLYPFKLDALKEIMQDYAPSHTNDDLLAIYAFTGGVPKYLELFCDNGALYSGKMLEKYFKQKMAESLEYREIGSWWESRGNQNETS